MLKHSRTLVYYDGPEVLVAEDPLGTKHLCVLVEVDETSDTFVCVPISAARLEEFMLRTIDLRSLIESPETDELLKAVTSEADYSQLIAGSIEVSEVPPEWLPAPGFFLPAPHPAESLVAAEAQQRNRAVLHCSLNPPESRGETKISALHLGQALKLMQRLVKHAYSRSIVEMDSELRQLISLEPFHQLEVFAFSEGSFTVHMQSAVPADLVGYVQVARAFELIDKVTALVDNPDAAVDLVAELGGWFATAYRDLMEFISEVDTPLSYEWAMPETPTSRHQAISTAQARPLYEALSARVDIGVEYVHLVGRLTKVDEKYGTWRLKTVEDGKERSGKLDPDASVDLSGLVIGTELYEFQCEERLEEERGTGRESAQLYLISHRKL